MKLQPYILASLLFLLTSLVNGKTNATELPVKLYKTHEDYKNSNGIDAGLCTSWTSSSGYTLKTKKGNIETKYKLKEYWGIELDGVLYRYDLKFKIPVKLIFVGKILYYEHGVYHFREQMEGKGWMEASMPFSYFSYTPDSEIKSYYKLKKIKAEKPEFAPMVDCIKKLEKLGQRMDYSKVRECVIEHTAK